MAVYVSNLVINTGTSFSHTFNLEATETNSAYDLTGATPASQIRKHASSSSKTDFTTAINGAATNGAIDISLTPTQTSALKAGRYVYDIVITIGETKTTVVEGSVLVRAGVTR